VHAAVERGRLQVEHTEVEDSDDDAG
jgi:hypothetical protein